MGMAKAVGLTPRSERQHFEGPEIAGRDPEARSQAAELSFQIATNRRSFRFLLAYNAVQVAYVGFYLCMAQSGYMNYLPLLADCIMLILHGFSLVVKARRDFNETVLYKLSFTFALLIDAVLLAAADPVVELQATEAFNMAGLMNQFGGAPSLRHGVLPTTNKSNLVFLFHCLYMILLVLSFRWAAYVIPMGMGLYSAIVSACYYKLYASYKEVKADGEEVLIEMFLMWCVLALGLFAKRSIEIAQKPLFLALETRKDEIIREKVKRCHAEHQASGLQDKLNKITHVNTLQLAPESVISAPARTSRRLAKRHQASNDKACESGDCLPSDAHIWIENQAMPQQLGSVEAGQRVLCFDSLMRGLKYADILEVSRAQSSETSEWVTIKLEDGTQLEMTPNHPVQCTSSDGSRTVSAKCIPAGNLQADRDSIMVLKTMSVPVTNVQRTREPDEVREEVGARQPREWIDIRVQHPDRHTVFVSQGGGMQPRGAMAVGTPDFSQAEGGYSIKRTFINVDDDDSILMETMSMQHAASEPELKHLGEDLEIGEGLDNGFNLDTISLATQSTPSPPLLPRMPVVHRVAAFLAEASGAFSRLSTASQEQIPAVTIPTGCSSENGVSMPSSSANSDHVDGGTGEVALAGRGDSATSGAEGKSDGGRRRERQREKRRTLKVLESGGGLVGQAT